MVPAVVLALVLVVPSFGLPLTTQGQTPTGVHETTVTGPITQDVEKTGLQGTPAGYSGPTHAEVYPGQQYTGPVENVPVPKVQAEPVGSEQTQTPYSETPVLLPVQPLSVVPVGQVGQILKPVVVPAEAIASGRVIIMTVEPIGQRVFQEVTSNPQTPYQQQVVQQPVEQVQQVYTVPQEVHQQIPQLANYAPEQNYKTSEVQGQVVEPYEQQQQTVGGTFEKQGVVDYTPVQTQGFVPSQQQQHIQQHPVQQTYSYSPVQTQGVEHTQQQQQYQQSAEYNPVRTQSVESVQQPQTYDSVEKQSEYTSVQTPSTQTVQHEPVAAGKQAISVPEHAPVQTVETVQQQQNYKPVDNVEKYVPHQQPVSEYTPVQSAEPVQQQQTYNVQPVSVEKHQPVQHPEQPQYTPVQPQLPESIQKQGYTGTFEGTTYQQTTGITQEQTRIGEVPHNPVSVQPQVSYNFGDRVPQPVNPVQTLSAVPYPQQQQQQSVNTSS